MKFYVYALLAPGTDAIRYVGKSSNPSRRLASHASKSGAPAVRDWIATIGHPELRILDSFTDETEALLSEQLWIRKLRGDGHLLNVQAPFDCESFSEERFTGFGSRCVSRRKLLRMTQVRLAQLIGMLPSGLSRIESSDRPGLKADTAVLIARALDCSVEWLVTGEERESVSIAAE